MILEYKSTYINEWKLVSFIYHLNDIQIDQFYQSESLNDSSPFVIIPQRIQDNTLND